MNHSFSKENIKINLKKGIFHKHLLLTTAISMKIKLNGLFPRFELLFKTGLHTFRFQSMFSASLIKNFNQEVFTENKKPGNTKPHVLAMTPPKTNLFSTHLEKVYTFRKGRVQPSVLCFSCRANRTK